MRQLLTALILTVSLTSQGQEFEFNYHRDFNKILEQTNDSSSTLHYNKLLTRFQSNDTSLTDYEVLSLLIGFTDNEHFKPYSYLSTERKIYSLNGNGNYKEALSMCDSFLLYVPLSQQALIEKSYSFYKLEQPDSSDFYLWKFKKIMEAMGQSGNGITAETAFFALGPADGQNFIRKYLASDIGKMGSGRDKNGNFVDILEMVWEDKETGDKQSRNLYFQIEHASKTMFGNLDFKKLDKNKKRKRKKKIK
ncbi:MAG: DUF4919 domain-containing protein [Saprospiraceae bacterium]|nr:DUF4919 domain-containing protein [Saprospiraceae bacterium]